MFDIVFLGTSASAPSIHRGLSSAAVLAGEDRFLVDCGEGTQRQILRSGIGFKRLNHILLTHAHLDHILGLGGLISTYTRWESLDSLHIWGGQPAIDRVEALLFQVVLRGQTPPMPIHLNALNGEQEIFRGKNYTVTAFPVTHRGRGNFGYIFKEDNRRPFLVEKAEALGVPAGPERSQLVKGEAVTLADGRVIQPDMVLGDEIEGVKLVVVGDTARTDNLVDYAQDADALVVEATFLHDDADMAKAYGHITAQQAGELAQQANVRHLLLNHISRRYREYDVISEARATFDNAYVVRDLDHFSVRRGQPVQKVESTSASDE